MALFGWIVLVALSVVGTVGYGLVAANGLGVYNIGGVPNGLRKKAGILCAGVALLLWWLAVANWAPFTFSVAWK